MHASTSTARIGVSLFRARVHALVQGLQARGPGAPRVGRLGGALRGIWRDGRRAHSARPAARAAGKTWAPAPPARRVRSSPRARQPRAPARRRRAAAVSASPSALRALEALA